MIHTLVCSNFSDNNLSLSFSCLLSFCLSLNCRNFQGAHAHNLLPSLFWTPCWTLSGLPVPSSSPSHSDLFASSYGVASAYNCCFSSSHLNSIHLWRLRSNSIFSVKSDLFLLVQLFSSPHSLTNSFVLSTIALFFQMRYHGCLTKNGSYIK